MSVSPNPARILIVDDEPHMLRLSEAFLRKGGFDSFLFGVNGIEAVKVAREMRPDLIIIDYMMPELDGLGALHQLKTAQETASIPVILVSGCGEFHPQDCDVEAASAVLKKPYNPELLVETAHRALSHRTPTLAA